MSLKQYQQAMIITLEAIFKASGARFGRETNEIQEVLSAFGVKDEVALIGAKVVSFLQGRLSKRGSSILKRMLAEY